MFEFDLCFLFKSRWWCRFLEDQIFFFFLPLSSSRDYYKFYGDHQSGKAGGRVCGRKKKEPSLLFNNNKKHVFINLSIINLLYLLLSLLSSSIISKIRFKKRYLKAVWRLTSVSPELLLFYTLRARLNSDCAKGV